MELFGFSVNLILLIVCFLIGISFLIYPTPKEINLHSYRISKHVLALSYFVMALLNAVIMFLDFGGQSPEYFNFIVLLISSLQATLFTYALIILLNPDILTCKRVFYSLLPVVLFTIVYITLALKVGDCKISTIAGFKTCIANPAVKVRLFFFLYYCFQLVMYSILFLKQEKKYITEINNNYSDVSKVSLRWVKWAFFAALSIGVMAIFISILSGTSADIYFNILLTVFYFIFAVKYINYNKIYYYLALNMSGNETPQSSVIIPLRTRIVWGNLKKQILEEKLYLKEGITLNEIAQLLKVGRSTLSNFINTEEGVSFNTWINKLRIEDAKSIINSNPDFSIRKIAELAGYSEQSNFSRQFKIFTGESPLNWRKKLLSH